MNDLTKFGAHMYWVTGFLKLHFRELNMCFFYLHCTEVCSWAFSSQQVVGSGNVLVPYMDEGNIALLYIAIYFFTTSSYFYLPNFFRKYACLSVCYLPNFRRHFASMFVCKFVTCHNVWQVCSFVSLSVSLSVLSSITHEQIIVSSPNLVTGFLMLHWQISRPQTRSPGKR